MWVVICAHSSDHTHKQPSSWHIQRRYQADLNSLRNSSYNIIIFYPCFFHSSCYFCRNWPLQLKFVKGERSTCKLAGLVEVDPDELAEPWAVVVPHRLGVAPRLQHRVSLQIMMQSWACLYSLHRKKRFSIFPSPAGMSLTNLFLGGNNLYMTSLVPPRLSLLSDIPAGDGNIENLFLQWMF